MLISLFAVQVIGVVIILALEFTDWNGGRYLG